MLAESYGAVAIVASVGVAAKVSSDGKIVSSVYISLYENEFCFILFLMPLADDCNVAMLWKSTKMQTQNEFSFGECSPWRYQNHNFTHDAIDSLQ